MSNVTLPLIAETQTKNRAARIRKANELTALFNCNKLVPLQLPLSEINGWIHRLHGAAQRGKLEPLIQELRAIGGQAHGYRFDARNEDVTKPVFKEIEDSVGPIDLVVFNVGGNVYFPILETTARVFRKVWEMACFSGFLTGREAAKYMVPRGKGKIFFTGASASVRGKTGYSAFSAGKAGMRMLSQSLARELGPKNIHVVHLITDAGVDTEFVRERIRSCGRDPQALEPARLMSPQSVVEAYWMLYHQTRDGWTHELDLRPFAETW
ncbi:MAG: SDR family NAD(P)-dependent oxidoreductase [Cellvibrionales bacterium]